MQDTPDLQSPLPYDLFALLTPTGRLNTRASYPPLVEASFPSRHGRVNSGLGTERMEVFTSKAQAHGRQRSDSESGTPKLTQVRRKAQNKVA